MRGLVLLFSVAVVALRGAAALEPVTCSGGDEQQTNAMRFALHHINQNQDHGYKFRMSEVLANNVVPIPQGCSIVMRLNLQETKCPVSHPKHFEDCEFRDPVQTVVMAGCVVVITVQNDQATVVSHKCQTTKDEEPLKMCPDCPRLMDLTGVDSLKRINDVIRKYNVNNATEHYFVLSSVGRIRASFMMGVGMNYGDEFEMVESHCPVGTRIAPAACTPLCPERARHIFCKSTANPRGTSLYCETYPAADTRELQPDENEPVCPDKRFNPAVQCTEGPALKDIHPICSWPPGPVMQQRN